MGDVDREDDRIFKINLLNGEGIAKLREAVKEKLKEFMGEYTDDTLVEYVIVLLRNGRRKEEARNELNVFLGDDGDPFVSWLWDHLSANLKLYLRLQQSHVQEGSNKKSRLENVDENIESQLLDSESERGKSSKLYRNRRSREWNALSRSGAEAPPLISSEVHKVHVEERTDHEIRNEQRSPSSQSRVQRKRSRLDDQQYAKRELIGDAPRRLLQVAVRDALTTSKPSDSKKEPGHNRLRSVVAASPADSLLVAPRKIQSVAMVPNPMSSVINDDDAEAAEGVRRVKYSRSVFDRLGRSIEESEMPDLSMELREPYEEDEEYRNIMHHHRGGYGEQYSRNMTMMESETSLGSRYMSAEEHHDDVRSHRGIDYSWTGSSGVKKDEKWTKVQYHLEKEQDHPVTAASASSRILNFSAKSNTPKLPNNQESKEVANLCRPDMIQGTGMRTRKGYSNHVTDTNAKSAIGVRKESPKMLVCDPGTNAANCPLEDAESRTIFVSNVHFAATKESLSRHFNKFGEVLKVVILTDVATGQPKGSAYIEFISKDAADNSLSIDGTSFMSRILKVLKKGSAPQEATAPVTPWPRGFRAPTYPVARFPRVPYPRVVPAAFWPRPPVNFGSRSLQWKRDEQTAAANNVPTPVTRSLTYVRSGPKSDINSTTT